MSRVHVGRGIGKSSHDLALRIGEELYGLRVDGGLPDLGEDNLSPTTIFKSTPQQRFGDYDPSFSELQQDTWVGGINQEEYHDDTTRHIRLILQALCHAGLR